MKKQLQEDLKRKPSACPSCTTNNSSLIEAKKTAFELKMKLEEQFKKNQETESNTANLLRGFMEDIEKLTADNKKKDSKIAELNGKLGKLKAVKQEVRPLYPY